MQLRSKSSIQQVQMQVQNNEDEMLAEDGAIHRVVPRIFAEIELGVTLSPLHHSRVVTPHDIRGHHLLLTAPSHLVDELRSWQAQGPARMEIKGYDGSDCI